MWTEWCRRWAAGLAAASVILVGGCGDAPESAKKKEKVVVADVNGESITADDVFVALLVQGKPTLTKQEGEGVLRAVVEQLVDQRIVLQRFRESSQPVDEQEVETHMVVIAQQFRPGELDAMLKEEGIEKKKWIQAVREALEFEHLLSREVYSKLTVSDAEVQADYEKNRKNFERGRRWRVRQIVVDAEEKALRLRKLVQGGASFAQLAEEHSAGPERNRGGDIGVFSLGQLPESIEKVIGALQGNEVSRPVQTSAGYHIFQVTERRMAGVLPLSTVQEQIRTEILTAKGRLRLKDWISRLKSKSHIKYHWSNLRHVLPD
ncbi:MAG: peptidyl-prolyl cis-trans isomerase [bacterium]|nr:peptidyl-prolyl cis-trans isomerase [bacterium]